MFYRYHFCLGTICLLWAAAVAVRDAAIHRGGAIREHEHVEDVSRAPGEHCGGV